MKDRKKRLKREGKKGEGMNAPKEQELQTALEHILQ